jgi:hypothetical protein
MAPEEQQAAVQEGSRWLHAKPTGAEFAAWFNENVPVHDGLDASKYVGGVTLISATEKVKLTKFKQNGDPYTHEVEHAVFIPYAKVETRVKYFRDLMEAKADEWIGVIRPADVQRYADVEQMQRRFFNGHLPPGFFIHPQTWFASQKENVSLYIGYAAEVLVYRKDDWFEKGHDAHPVISGFGTKAVPAQKNYPDDTALMKAETGAVGRALGMAGMLVIPGSGVATAEDVQEAQASETVTPQASPEATPATVAAVATTTHAPEAPAAATQAPAQATTTAPEGQPVPQAGAGEEPSDEDMRQAVAAMISRLESEHPETLERFRAWYREQSQQRNMGELHTLQGPALRGIVRRLERALATAETEKQAAAAAGPPEPPAEGERPVPAEGQPSGGDRPVEGEQPSGPETASDAS